MSELCGVTNIEHRQDRTNSGASRAGQIAWASRGNSVRCCADLHDQNAPQLITVLRHNGLQPFDQCRCAEIVEVPSVGNMEGRARGRLRQPRARYGTDVRESRRQSRRRDYADVTTLMEIGGVDSLLCVSDGNSRQQATLTVFRHGTIKDCAGTPAVTDTCAPTAEGRRL